MTTHAEPFTRTYGAGGDLSGSRYRFMTFTAERVVNIASGIAVNRAIGVLMNDPTSGQAARIAIGGQAKVYAGGTVTAGLLQTHGTSGAILDATSGQLIVGRAITAGAAGDLCAIELCQPFFAAVAV